MEKLATAVDVFHIAWAVALLWLSIFSFFRPELRPYQIGMVAGTIFCQLIFLGCPLTLLSGFLRGRPSSGSFTIYLLNKVGVELHPILVTISLLLMFLIAGGWAFKVARSS